MGAMVMGAMVIAKNILFHLIHLHVYKAKSILAHSPFKRAET